MYNRLYVISGAAGMTGSELARQLTGRGDYVIGFDNFFASSREVISDVLQSRLFEFYEYDINSSIHMNDLYDKVQEKMGDVGETVFINCAAVVHTEYFYRVNDTFTTNVIAMKQFLDMAVKLKCHQYINCSTSEVYSMQSWNEHGGVKESDYVLMSTAEHSQRTSYAAGKLITEFFMKDAVENGLIKGCSIRFANVYSKNEKYAKHIIPHIVKSLQYEGKVVLLENAEVTKRTFLHNTDSCSGVLALSDTGTALDGGIYNIATDEEIGIVDLVYLIAGKMNISNPEIEYEGYRTADPERRLLDTTKIKEATGWKPEISLIEGIDMVIKYIRDN